MRVLTIVLALAVGLPASAQDAPLLESAVVANKLAPCQPGDVVLKPDVAIATAKRLADAEVKVKVYEAHPPLPAWGVILLVVAGVAAGVAGSVIVYEVVRKP